MKKLLTLTCCILLVSCGQSIGDLDQQWNETEEMVKNSATKYPSFAEDINMQFQKAVPIMEEAQALTDEDEKKKKIKQAIAKAKKGTLDKIINLERQIAEVKKHQKSLKEETTGTEETDENQELLNNTDKLILESEATLNGQYTSVDSANAMLDKNLLALEEQESILLLIVLSYTQKIKTK